MLDIKRAILIGIACLECFAMSASVVPSSASSTHSGVRAPVHVPLPTQMFTVTENAILGTSTFDLTDDAKSVFSQLSGPVYVVSMSGIQQKLGRSTLLSLFVREW